MVRAVELTTTGLREESSSPTRVADASLIVLSGSDGYLDMSFLENSGLWNTAYDRSPVDAHLSGTDLIITRENTTDLTVDLSSISGDDAVWGNITGTLSNQTDLQNALDDKADLPALTSHTSDSTIHFTQAQIEITESQISDLGDYLEQVAIPDLTFTPSDWITAGTDLAWDGSTLNFTGSLYSSSNFDTDFASKNTDDLSEGISNLYFTDARAVSAIKADSDWNAGNWDTAYDRSPTDLTFAQSTNEIMLHRQGVSNPVANISDVLRGADSLEIKDEITSTPRLHLVGDEDSPGADKVYGTDGTGNKGWLDMPSGGSVDEEANYNWEGAHTWSTVLKTGATQDQIALYHNSFDEEDRRWNIRYTNDEVQWGLLIEAAESDRDGYFLIDRNGNVHTSNTLTARTPGSGFAQLWQRAGTVYGGLYMTTAQTELAGLNGNNIRIMNDSGTGRGTVNCAFFSSRNARHYGSWFDQTSDARKKEIHGTSKVKFDDIKHLRAKIYNLIDGEDIVSGWIAQDFIGKCDTNIRTDEEGFYSMDYSHTNCDLISAMLEKMTEMDEAIKELKKAKG